VNLTHPDPAATEFLPCLRAEPLEAQIGAALSTSFGFGGLNAALSFSQVRQ
jgi:3-oxoacyl-(acyl-carrier-protein) synthase